MSMEKFTFYFSILIVLGFFILATYLLISPSFSYLSTEIRVVFAVFLYLYGAFRILRILTKHKKQNTEEE
ncbi:MAG: hypothetical protein D4R67_12090 [Bacteroidetes bacterium]|nr:MAG: hypothetical protein D4R67_12090 [Bacteroidota bacterium]